MKKSLHICLDGCSPEYISASEMPNIDKIAEMGFYIKGSSMIPSVTNVNNVSIVTGKFPKEHGITSNFCYDRDNNTFEFMESADYLKAETVLERAKALGLSTGLITSKLKLLNLLKKGADIGFSAEEPLKEYVELAGESPNIYSMDINIWVFEAGYHLIKNESPDIVYLSTTDYVMHKYAPEEEVSLMHLNGIDHWIGKILEEEPDRDIYITADHGMNPKTRAINLSELLEKEGISAEVIPIIKDRYVAHHQNLGGAAYIYLNEQKDMNVILDILNDVDFVEEVYTASQAADEFNLLCSRIGDLMVLAPEDTVYGSLDGIETTVDIRSHGSKYEQTVPLISTRKKLEGEEFIYNMDLVKNLSIMKEV